MNDNFEQDIEQYRQLLDNSTENLDPAITAQLNSARRSAVRKLDGKPVKTMVLWRPAFALSLSIAAISMFIFSPTSSVQEPANSDLYSDLEILMDEEQLDFLAELEIAQWMESENEG